MASPGYGNQPPTLPSAPPMDAVSAGDDLAPPSYEEAIRAPSGGGSFNSVSSALRPEAVPNSTPWPPGGTAVAHADTEAGRVGQGQTNAADTSAPPPTSGDDPPSYNSLFGQIREAKDSSSGLCDFMLNLLLMPVGCLVGLVMVAAVVGLVFGVPITLIVVGSLFLHDCPITPGIPIWMVTGGVLMVVYIFWVGCTDEEHSGRQGVAGGLFYLAFYISGCVLVYPTWQPPFEPSFYGDTHYCDYTAMMTSFVIINLMSVLTGVAFCAGCL
ncbi:uncharacterized protein LOC122382991 isoform X2 [Amphibalanus amphitrite]|uniref:uncharacterized protein LOC122382991 isoform X2 n=1 Tax=Amphibalanus amphitrite TaxID=1232801 RepID=UPI001C926A7A|nr:uncharacterized protein LOC122382991 isoform X2 [Amphibalanus amphitrite]